MQVLLAPVDLGEEHLRRRESAIRSCFGWRAMRPSPRSRPRSSCCSRSRSKSVQVAQRQGQGEALRPLHRPPQPAGRRPTSRLKAGQEINFAAGEMQVMALVKVKPTSPGRRALVKVVNRDSAQGAARRRRSSRSSQSKRAGRNTYGHITMRHQGGGHKQHYRIIDFRRNKDGDSGQGRAHRVRSEPQRPPRAALLRRRRAPLRHRGQGRRGGRAADERLGRADQAGQHAAAAQHPGRHDHPLRRDAARQGRADRARGRHLGAAARPRRQLRAAAAALRRDSQGARRLPRHHRRGRQRGALAAVDRQGGREALARHPSDGARRGDESDRPPARRRRRQDRRRRRPGQPVGRAHQGLQDAQEQAHATA